MTAGIIIMFSVLLVLAVAGGIVWIILSRARAGGGAMALPAMSGRTVGIIIGICVLLALMMSSILPWQTWLMLALAGVVAFVYHASMLGKVAAGVLLAFGLVYGVFHGILGDKAEEVAKKNQKEIAATLTGASSPASATTGTGVDRSITPLPQPWRGHNILPVSGTQYLASRWERLEPDGTVPKGATTIVRFPYGECKVHYDTPPGFIVRVSNGNDRKWTVAEEKKRDYVLDRVQFEATDEGLTPPKVTVTCP